MALVSEALGDHHDLSIFASGTPSIDSWLAEHARGAEARRVARTFVWHQGDGVVVGYYSLAAHVLVKDQLPRALGRGVRSVSRQSCWPAWPSTDTSKVRALGP